jgi:hypothetical protein
MDNRGVADKRAGVVAVVAGLIAGVELAPGDPREIQSRSPRVRSIIGDSITIAARWSGQQSEATITVTMCN